MSLTVLNVEKREKKGGLSTLRSEGKIPANVYGGKGNPELITVDLKELTKESKKQGFYSRVIQLQEGKNKVDVITKDIQLDPVRSIPMHADFVRVTKEQKIRVFVPIQYINEEKSPAIKRGGLLNIVHHSLEVSCSPYEIPEALSYDLSGLEMQGSVHLTQLKLPKGVDPVHPKRDNVLATVVAPKDEDKGEGESDSSTEEAK